jgi:hypothetical protein
VGGEQRFPLQRSKGNSVNGLHILTRNRTKKPLTIALSGAGKGLGERW